MNNNNKISRLSTWHFMVHTQIEINQPVEKVWQTLINSENMSKWSNALRKIEGEIEEGNRVTLHYLVGGKVKKFKVTLINVIKDREFGWSESLIPLAKDNHRYKLEPLPGRRCRLIQSDGIKGFSALFIGKAISSLMLRQFETFNEALKREVEGLK